MYDKLQVFQMAKQRMDWVAERQAVLSKNIANADTPKYQPKDVEKLTFKETLVKAPQVSQSVTHSGHIASPLAAPTRFDTVNAGKPYETSPDGNSVVLEEQMLKMASGRSAYNVAANLFQKNMKMIKIALGKGGG